MYFYNYAITHFSEAACNAMYWMSVFCAVVTVAISAYTMISLLHLKKSKTNSEDMK